MPSRHQIDRDTHFDRAVSLPASRAIEVIDEETPIGASFKTEPRDREPYLASESLQGVVNLAIALGRPLLLQGDPGSGKTRLAYAVAYALGLPLEECYIKSTTRAQDLLYAYDAVNRLYDAQLGSKAPKTAGGKLRSSNVRNYIRLGPLGRAFARAKYKRRTVVLIDEIDKADIDFPNDLLRELDRMEFDVPEAPGMGYSVPQDKPELRPIIIVTHNEEKALPAAFLRRCIYHFVSFPAERAQLETILAEHAIGKTTLTDRAIDVLVALRQMDLQKPPALSELLDWVGYLQLVQAKPDELYNLPHGEALLKHVQDQERAKERLKRLGEERVPTVVGATTESGQILSKSGGFLR